jgi:hypothetical protein
MNAPQPQSFEILFNKRDELLILDPGQRIESAEIVATCEVVQELSDIFPIAQEEFSFTYTRS